MGIESRNKYLILGSDGLFVQNITNIVNLFRLLLQEGKTLEEISLEIIEYTIKQGSQDDISIIIVDL